MVRQHLLHGAGGQAVARHVDHVVGTRHDEHVAVGIDVTRVAGFVVAGEAVEIGRLVALRGVPQGGEGARGQRRLDHQRADFTRRCPVAVGVQHLHVVTRHRPRRRARHDGQLLYAQAVGTDRPAGLGLPPVVDHRHLQFFQCPLQGVGIAAFTGQEQRPQPGVIVFFQVAALGVFLPDGAKRGGRREQHLHIVLFDYPPEGAGVRRAHRLALVQHGGVTVEQRAVADIGVPHHPAHIRGRPVHLAGVHVVHVLHAPLQADDAAAGVAHHPLGLAGGAGGIENIQRVVGVDRHTVNRRRRSHRRRPVEVPARHQRSLLHRPLQDDAGGGFVRRQPDRLVQQRLVGHHPARFHAAGGRHDHRRRRVVDAHRQFIAGEAAEHHRVDRADAGAGEHGDNRLGHHGHIDDNPVAPRHTLAAQQTGAARHLVQQLAEGIAAFAGGDRAVVDQRRLLAPALLDVNIHRVETGIGDAVRVPAVERRVAVIQQPRRRPEPVDIVRGLLPQLVVIHHGADAFRGRDDWPLTARTGESPRHRRCSRSP